jgi:hypothetical protein
MFLPVTIQTLQSLGRSDREAVAYVHDVTCRSLPWVFALAVVGGEIAPWFLRMVFPRYAVDPVTVRTMIYSVSVLPILATAGNLLIGGKRGTTYALVLGAAMAAAGAAEMVLRQYVGTRAAALAQLAGMFLLGAMLLAAVRLCYRRASRDESISWWRPGILLAGFWAAYLSARALVGEALS